MKKISAVLLIWLSVAVVLSAQDAVLSQAAPKNWSNPAKAPQNIRIPDLKVDAVVIPDMLGESLVLPVEKKALRIPGSSLFVLLLAEKGNKVYTAVWNKENTDITVSDKDFSAILPQGGSLRLYELFGKNIWYRGTAELSEKEWLPIQWKTPFPAKFQAVFRKKIGVIPPEDGRMENWIILPYEKTGKNKLFPDDKWIQWTSGYGFLPYPARATPEAVLLRLIATADPYQIQKFESPHEVWIYPWQKENRMRIWDDMNLPKANPQILLPFEAAKDFLSPEDWFHLSPRRHPCKEPATCATTVVIEKIFYRGKSAEQKKEIMRRVASMDYFVRAIRLRIEEYRSWAILEKTYLQANAPEDLARPFIADFDFMESYYQRSFRHMKTLEDYEKLSGEYVSLADKKDMDEEAKEERCKELGRLIRTLGGFTDRTAAQGRRIARSARQKATEMYTVENDSSRRAFLEHIRQTAAKALWNFHYYEGK